jgi:hypothetical protein
VLLAAGLIAVALLAVMLFEAMLSPLRPLELSMAWAARVTADFPTAMMALKRAVAEGGLRRHRTTAKPGQRRRHPPPVAAASPWGPESPAFRAVMAQVVIAWAVIAGQVRPEMGARNRVPFLQAVHSGA